MTQKEIQAILGIHKSTISRILKGNTVGYSQQTINEVTLLSGLKEKYFDRLFELHGFALICKTVIDKGTSKDSKNFVEVSNFACLCLNKHQTLNNPDEAKTMEELLGKYYEDSDKLLRHEYFLEMCSIAIRRNPSIRLLAGKLMALSITLRNINKKGVAE